MKILLWIKAKDQDDLELESKKNKIHCNNANVTKYKRM